MYNINHTIHSLQPTIQLQQNDSPENNFMNSDFCNLIQHPGIDDQNMQYSFSVPTVPPKHPSKKTTIEPTISTLEKINEYMKDYKLTIVDQKQFQIRRGQNNIGANASVTNDKDSIVLYKDIKQVDIGGV